MSFLPSTRDLGVLGAGFGLGYLAARALGSSTGDASDTGGTDASGAGEPYVLVYHAKLGFRAAPIQMLLIDAGRAFEMAEPHWGTDRVIENNPGLPSFAPPALRKGDVTVAQTPAILAFLDATVLGRSTGDRVEEAMRLQLLLDIGDVTSELFTEVRKGAEAKAKFGRLEEGGRLRNWLAHICKFFLRAGGGTGFLLGGGGGPTAADFFLLSAVESIEFCYGARHTAALLAPAPELRAWRSRMQARPFFAKYRAQAKPILFESMRHDEE